MAINTFLYKDKMNMCDHGLVKAPQTPMKVKDDLLDYLKEHFSE